MRKNDKRSAPSDSKLKFRVIEFEVEGDSTAIHEGLRSIQAAIARPKVQSLPEHYVAIGSGPIDVATPDEFPKPASADPSATVEQSDAESSEPSPVRRSPPRREKLPDPLEELDIQSGPVSLKNFYAEKSPNSIQATFLVLIYWLKKYRNYEVVGPSHIFTCYSLLELPTPKSFRSPLRDMKKRNKWLEKAEGVGEYRLTLLGHSAVERMGVEASP